LNTTPSRLFPQLQFVSRLVPGLRKDVVFTPLLHRFPHKLHADEDDVREGANRD